MIIGLSLLIFVLVLLLFRQNYINSEKIKYIELNYKSRLQEERDKAVRKSKEVTRGHVSQEFLPLFPDFPYNMSDCKFSGSPLDFIVFKGMSDLRDGKETELEIIFADVKTQKSQRSKIQNAIKKAIESNKVTFETWTVQDNKQIKVK